LTVDIDVKIKVFYGFVFKMKRSKDQMIQVTAYDQMRYLKNKDTKIFENITASGIIKTLADDFQLKTDDIEDTEFKLIQANVKDFLISNNNIFIIFI
jgi:hypothetical protein